MQEYVHQRLSKVLLCTLLHLPLLLALLVLTRQVLQQLVLLVLQDLIAILQPQPKPRVGVAQKLLRGRLRLVQHFQHPTIQKQLQQLH